MSDENNADAVKPTDEEAGTTGLRQLSISALKKRIGEIQAVLDEKVEEEKRRLQSHLEREAEKLGLSPSIVWSAAATVEPEASAPKKTRGKVPPKYRGPNGKDWSGRGRKPKWVAEVEKAGESLDQFLIK